MVPGDLCLAASPGVNWIDWYIPFAGIFERSLFSA